MNFPKSRFWSGLKSFHNIRLNEKNRLIKIKARLEKQAGFDVTGQAKETIFTLAIKRRVARRLKNIELKSRGG